MDNNSNNDNLGFGEDKELIDYIMSHLSPENKVNVTPEIIDNVLTFMLDYYDEQGFFDDEDPNFAGDEKEVEINEGEMLYFIENKIKEQAPLTEEQLQEILDLEFEFNQKNGVYK